MPLTSEDAGDASSLPPRDILAEKAVLGAMLLSKDAIADIVEILGPTDFYDPDHQATYEAILTLYADKKPADPVSVSAALAEAGILERIGEAPYLASVMDAVTPGTAPIVHARKVRDTARRRRLLLAGQKIAQLATTETANIDDAIDLVRQPYFVIMAEAAGNRAATA